MTKTDTRERSAHTNTIPGTGAVAAAELTPAESSEQTILALTIYISQTQTLSTHQIP